MNLREAAEKALDCLDYYRSLGALWDANDEQAYQALRTALAEAAEPPRREPLTEEQITVLAKW